MHNMMKVVNKDIRTIKKGTILHGVNCKKRMASGIAKAIRGKWPIVYDVYMLNGQGREMLGVAEEVQVDDDLWVINCYTQEYYGYDGRKYADIEAIRKSLTYSFKFAQINDSNICMPKIGCGLGGLDWDSDVKPIVVELSDNFDINVYIYEI